MFLPGMWIAVDVVGTQLSDDVFIHSAAGDRIARPLRRCASKLGMNRAGESVFRTVVDRALADRPVVLDGDIFTRTHRIDAADGTRIGLIVWVSPTPPTPRPTYNAWICDLAALTSRTSGDDPSLIGDGRTAGEERSVQQLFTWLNPEDARSWLGVYYDALTGVDGLLLQLYWSLRPGGTDWVHLWSSCRLRVGDSDQRVLYGLTLALRSRDVEANIAALVRHSRATLLLVERSSRIPITTVGCLAPLDESRIAQVLEQADLDLLVDPQPSGNAEQGIHLDGQLFLASAFALRSIHDRHGDPIAVVLRPADDTWKPV